LSPNKRRGRPNVSEEKRATSLLEFFDQENFKEGFFFGVDTIWNRGRGEKKEKVRRQEEKKTLTPILGGIKRRVLILTPRKRTSFAGERNGKS